MAPYLNRGKWAPLLRGRYITTGFAGRGGGVATIPPHNGAPLWVVFHAARGRSRSKWWSLVNVNHLSRGVCAACAAQAAYCLNVVVLEGRHGVLEHGTGRSRAMVEGRTGAEVHRIWTVYRISLGRFSYGVASWLSSYSVRCSALAGV